MVMRVSRVIDERARKRVLSMDSSTIKSYLSETTMSLNIALDAWTYHGAPSEEVTMAVDALVALWTEVESRKLDL